MSLLLRSCPSLSSFSDHLLPWPWLPAVYALTSTPGGVSQRKSDVSDLPRTWQWSFISPRIETAALKTAQGSPQPSKGLCPPTSSPYSPSSFPLNPTLSRAPEHIPGVAHGLLHPTQGKHCVHLVLDVSAAHTHWTQGPNWGKW